jgi:hypothetical protein
VATGIRLPYLYHDSKQIPLYPNQRVTPVSHLQPTLYANVEVGWDGSSAFYGTHIWNLQTLVPLPHQTIVPLLEIYLSGELSSFLGAG